MPLTSGFACGYSFPVFPGLPEKQNVAAARVPLYLGENRGQGRFSAPPVANKSWEKQERLTLAYTLTPQPVVKAAADRIAPSQDEDGLVEVVQWLLE